MGTNGLLRPYDPGDSPASGGKIFTVAEVFAWYEKTASRADVSAVGERERCRVRGLFSADYGNLPYSELRPFHVVAWLQSRAPNRAVWTRRRWVATVQRPFNYAVQLGLIDRNPVRGIRVGRGRQGRDWTDEEYRTILRNSSLAFRRFVVFCRLTGARPGEARTLEWSQIRLDILAIVQDRHKTANITGRPRVIMLTGPVVRLLAVMRRKAQRSSRFVFLNARGRPWRIGSLVEYLDLVRRRARLSPAVKLHGARHTFATGAVVNGVDLVSLAQLLGHESVASTQRYVHLAEKRAHLVAAAEKAIGRNPSR